MTYQTQFGLGKQQQAQQQAILEAQRQSELAQLYEPYQRLGFLSDIYRGAPTSQQTISQVQRPDVSPAQSIIRSRYSRIVCFWRRQTSGVIRMSGSRH